MRPEPPSHVTIYHVSRLKTTTYLLEESCTNTKKKTKQKKTQSCISVCVSTECVKAEAAMCARRAGKWKNTHLGPPRGPQAARSMHPRDLPALAPAHNRENVRHQKRAATVDPRAVLKLEGRTSRLDRLSLR